MATLADKDRARLIALLGMLGSNHQGERASAAAHVERFRREHGLSRADILATPPTPKPEPAPPPRREAPPQQSGPQWEPPPAPEPSMGAYGPSGRSVWWHWMAMIFVPWLYFPYLMIKECVAFVRWVSADGWTTATRHRFALNAYTLVLIIGVVLLAKYFGHG
jgi:hypothetical protein